MICESFDSIGLEEVNEVKLLNRFDRKYCFHIKHLAALIKEVEKDYYILNINNTTNIPYYTTYYDTFSNDMFLCHQNGKYNRYKIRRRKYATSETCYLEIKFKTNKGKTLKKRISSEYYHLDFTPIEFDFIKSNTPYICKILKPTLISEFTRCTLVNKNHLERTTIDINIRFRKDINQNYTDVNNLVILEIKTEGKNTDSPLIRALNKRRIKQTNISKYCIGRSIIDPSLKINSFKEKIRTIEKISSGNKKTTHNYKIKVQ